MKVIHNERAVYLIFPNDAASIQHSADELWKILKKMDAEEDADIFRPIFAECLALRRRMSQNTQFGSQMQSPQSGVGK